MKRSKMMRTRTEAEVRQCLRLDLDIKLIDYLIYGLGLSSCQRSLALALSLQYSLAKNRFNLVAKRSFPLSFEVLIVLFANSDYH